MAVISKPKQGIQLNADQLKMLIGGVGLLLVFAIWSATSCEPYYHGSSLSTLETSGGTRALQKGRAGSIGVGGRPPRLITAGEMKATMKLPCNYVHDGYYIKDSNEVLNQVYQNLLDMDDDEVPVMIECGGHDGITKSLSLKASICLNMNTLLIEGSPSNFETLQEARAYDFTVNAALCEGKEISFMENKRNSGENRIADKNNVGKNTKTVTVPCTSLDKELDKLKATLPAHQQDKLSLIFMILDVEGHEPTAIDGLKKYPPKGVDMEVQILSKADKDKIRNWGRGHGLEVTKDNGMDWCFNCRKLLKQTPRPSHLRPLLFAARWSKPAHTHLTKQVKRAYMYYGETGVEMELPPPEEEDGDQEDEDGDAKAE